MPLVLYHSVVKLDILLKTLQRNNFLMVSFFLFIFLINFCLLYRYQSMALTRQDPPLFTGQHKEDTQVYIYPFQCYGSSMAWRQTRDFVSHYGLQLL